MMRAFVLLKTKPGTSAKVVQNLRTHKNILWADCLYGRYDAIAIVQGEDKAVDSLIYNSIEKEPDIENTETLVCMHSDAVDDPYAEERLRSMGILQ